MPYFRQAGRTFRNRVIAQLMQPIKTILLLQDLLYGGTQRHTLELAKRLDPDLFQTEIWTLMGGGDFLPRARDYGLSVRHLHAGSSVGLAGVFGLGKALAQARPDVLMALTVVPNIWGRVLGRLARVPVVVANCRGGDDLWRQHEGLLNHLAHHHICNARALSDQLTGRYGLPVSRVTVIPTGVDTEFFAPVGASADADPVILCLARLVPVKDHDTLITAFEYVAARHPRARLRMVGDGELHASLARRVADSSFRERMELVPGCADPRPHYAAASIVALSSINEGMPNVLLEAMAMGLPTVGTDVGGVAEVVRHGRTGFVVGKKDPESMGQALARLLEDVALCKTFGREGRRIAVAEHSLESVAARHADILLELHPRKGLPGRKE